MHETPEGKESATRSRSAALPPVNNPDRRAIAKSHGPRDLRTDANRGEVMDSRLWCMRRHEPGEAGQEEGLGHGGGRLCGGLLETVTAAAPDIKGVGAVGRAAEAPFFACLGARAERRKLNTRSVDHTPIAQLFRAPAPSRESIY